MDPGPYTFSPLRPTSCEAFAHLVERGNGI
jgi:hypothetical protein